MIRRAKRLLLKLLPVMTGVILILTGFTSFSNTLASSQASSSNSDKKSAVDDIKALNNQLNTGLGDFKNASDTNKSGKLKHLEEIAQTRKDKLKKLIADDPADVGSVVIDNTFDYPQEVQSLLEKKTQKSGYLGKLIKDYKEGSETSDIIYQNSDGTGETFALVPDDSTKSIDASRVGKQVLVSGYQLDNVLWYPSGDNSTVLSPLVNTATNLTTGARNVAVFYVSFADNRQRELSTSQINSYVFSNYNNFLHTSSNNLFSISGNVYSLDLSVNKTCDLTPNFSLTGWQDGQLVSATKDAANAAGINLSNFQDYMIVIDPSNSCNPPGQSLLGPGWAYSVGLTSFAHEYGHNLYLAHAQEYECGDTFIRVNCNVIGYGNPYDIMGRSSDFGESFDAGDYGPYAKQYLGWLQGSQIVNVTSSGTFNLEPYEQLPGSSAKALRIPTFSGGPAYYVFYPRNNTTVQNAGPEIELTSGSLGSMRETYLLDTTPGSQSGLNDVFDGYLHDGQIVNDPYNGITFKGISHSSGGTTVEVDLGPKAAGSSSVQVTWGRATGYLEAVGQKKDISWSPVHFSVDVMCTGSYGCTGTWNQWSSNCASWPGGNCPPLDTTGTSLSIPVASSSSGYHYYYRVWVVTLDDNDTTNVNKYLWKNVTDATTNCNGPATCNTTISWPKITYKGFLFEKGTTNNPCDRMQIQGVTVGCVNSFNLVQDQTTFTYRGLPTGINFSGYVYITDFSGNNHVVKIYTDLGQSDSYTKSCSTSLDVTCTIPKLSFVGYEPVTLTVKAGGSGGNVIYGPENTLTLGDGSISRTWSWNYVAVLFPNNYTDCYSAISNGAQCQWQNIYNANSLTYSYTFSGLAGLQDYHFILCAYTCNPASGNSKLADSVVTSDPGSAPGFFTTDPFANNAYNGCDKPVGLKGFEVLSSSITRKRDVAEIKVSLASAGGSVGGGTYVPPSPTPTPCIQN